MVPVIDLDLVPAGGRPRRRSGRVVVPVVVVVGCALLVGGADSVDPRPDGGAACVPVVGAGRTVYPAGRPVVVAIDPLSGAVADGVAC